MGDVKLSQRATTTTRSDTDFKHIARYSGGVYTDYKIVRTDDEADIYTEIATKQDGLSIKLPNQNTTFSQAFSANTKIETIDIMWASGTAVLKIGTTLNGKEILEEETITSGVISIGWNTPYVLGQKIYFTLSGGVIHVVINYRINYFQTT